MSLESLETVCVKEEAEWEVAARGVSEAAAREGLYANHEVKDELVLGPEVMQPPDSASAASDEKCDVRPRVKKNKKTPKRYCIAVGCRNNDKNSNHAFFYLPSRPKDAERVRKWLTLLGREDLLGKERKGSRSVCSAHFDPSSIKISKTLEKDAVPTLLLANQLNSTSEALPASAQFKDTTVLSKSTGVASFSVLPSGSQIQDKGQVIVTEKIVKKNAITQTYCHYQEPLLERQTETAKRIERMQT